MVHRHHGAQDALRLCLHQNQCQGCPLSTCGFSAAVDPVLQSVLAELCTHYDSGAKLFAFLDDWYLWIKPQYQLQTIVPSLQPPDQSTLPYSRPRHKYGKALARTPFHLSSKTRSHSHSVAWVDIYKSMETLSPALSFWESRPSWRKQHNAFRKLPPHLQTLTIYSPCVGAASQHVLRMSFVSEQEAHNFDRQVMTFWSHLMHRDITSPLFFLPLKLGGLGVGSAVQRHAAAPWRAWQSIIPTLMATTQSPDTDSLFQFNTTTTSSTCTTPNHPFPTNE